LQNLPIMLLVAILSFLISTGITKNNIEQPPHDSSYYEDVRSFMLFFKESNNLSDTVIISSLAGGHVFNDCEPFLLKDTTDLTSDDREKIILALNNPLLASWTHDLIGGRNRILSQDSISLIFASGWPKEAWKTFHDKYGHGYTTFSAPIFLRNKSICIFYSRSNCGTGCMEAELNLYIKDNGKWKFAKTICYSGS
jgi:hypothetical protein